jgi:antitoxin PrlF
VTIEVTTPLRAKSQSTIPEAVRTALHVEEGDQLRWVVEDDGTVSVVGQRLIDTSQAWFWTDEWQAKEREADEAIAAGRVTRYQLNSDADVQAMFRDLGLETDDR